MDLVEARFRKKITQWDLALKTGISQSKISLFERGYIIPNDQEKAQIVGALKFDKIEWPERRNRKV